MEHEGSASQKNQNCSAKVGLSQPSDADTIEAVSVPAPPPCEAGRT